MMLAPNNTMDRVWKLAPLPMPEPDDYNGFPWWIGLMVEPSREQRSADWLRRLNVFVFWPNFVKQVQRRGKAHYPRLYGVIPGLLLAPIEVMDIPRRKEVFDYAHVRGFIRGAGEAAMRIPKVEIECIREIEAKLNTIEAGGIPGADGERLEVGQRVTFLNGLYAAFFGDGIVNEIVSGSRIGVEVSQLFGCPRTVYVPASEIEAM